MSQRRRLCHDDNVETILSPKVEHFQKRRENQHVIPGITLFKNNPIVCKLWKDTQFWSPSSLWTESNLEDKDKG